MAHKRGRGGAVRRKMWQSMRIIRRFTIPDIVRTAPGTTYGNARKFIANLVRHGYVVKNRGYSGGRLGEFQVFTLVKDVGPEYPTICARCGQPMNASVCSDKKKETETEKETERERR
ncbi:MAG: hypothetical protein C0621_10385 [Desulfuromonas sp.]|nr:MAG: hypothetical protein C0621_10385 [Desulfuromonas sp.]